MHYRTSLINSRAVATTLALTISAAALGGCGGALTQSSAGTNSQYASNGSLDRSVPVASPSPAATATAAPAATTQPVKEPVTVVLTTDKATYRRGEAVKLTITATSTGDKAETLAFADGQRFDITATPEAKTPEDKPELVWRWSHDQAFIQALGTEAIAPGEPKTWTGTWEQKDNDDKPVARGRYVLQAKITTTDGINAAPVIIELTDKE